jgi:putative ABC transport system ATP-binding protein
MVTHDPYAAAVADRILFLEDGRIVREMAGASADDIITEMKGLNPS